MAGLILMDAGQLASQLGIHLLPEEELLVVLQWHFGRGSQAGDRALALPTPKDPAMILTFRKDDSIESIEGGPALSRVDIATIHHRIVEAAAEHATKVHRSFLFSGVPVRGTWRHGDAWQLLPPPEHAPQPNQEGFGLFPAVVEVRVRDSAYVPLQIVRADDAKMSAHLSLSTLFNPGLDSEPIQSRVAWTRPVDDVDHPPRFSMMQYYLPGYPLVLDDFSDISGLPDLDAADPSEYFSQTGIRSGSCLTRPENLPDLLLLVDALTPEDRGKWERACYWLRHASRVHELSETSSYAALIQAIEALIPSTTPGPRCTTCGRATGPGATKQFETFLESHAPGASRGKQALYALRSAIVHGHTLLRVDRMSGMAPGHPRRWAEFARVDFAKTVTRIAAVNWLLRTAPPTVRTAAGDVLSSDIRTAATTPVVHDVNQEASERTSISVRIE